MLRNLNHHPHAVHHVVSASTSPVTAVAAVASTGGGGSSAVAAAGNVTQPLVAAGHGGFSIYSRNISFEQDYRSNYTYQNARSATSSSAAANGAHCNSLLPSPEESPTRVAGGGVGFRAARSADADSLVAGLERNGFYIVRSLPTTVVAKDERRAYTINGNNNNSSMVLNNNHVISKGMVESLHNYSKQQCEEETDRLRRKAQARGYNDEESDDDDEEDDDDADVEMAENDDEDMMDATIDVVAAETAEKIRVASHDEDVDNDETEELVIDEPAPGASVAAVDAAESANELPPPATPEHHARRPMNAFLIFCKRHRGIVREKYPNLENRAITKILGDWWANMDAAEKECFNRLAREYKDAFFSANPTFQWYKLPAPPLRTLTSRPGTVASHPDCSQLPASPMSAASHVGMFKLADVAHMGGLNELMAQPEVSASTKSRSEADRKSSDLQAALGDATSFFAKTMSTNRTEPFQHYRVVKRRSDPGASAATTSDSSLSPASPQPSAAKRSVSESSIVTSPADFERFVQANFKLAEEDDSNDHQTSTSVASMATSEPTTATAGDAGYTKSTRACKGKRYLEFINTVRVATVAPKKSPKAAAAVHTTTAHTTTASCIDYDMFDHMYASQAPAPTRGHPPSAALTAVAATTTPPSRPSALTNDSTTDFDLDGKIKALLALSLDEYLSRKRDTKKKKKVSTKKTPSTVVLTANATKRPKHSAQSSRPTQQQQQQQHRPTFKHTQATAQQYQDHQQQMAAMMRAQSALERRDQLLREHQSTAVGSQKRKARKESITRRDVVVTMAAPASPQPPSPRPVGASPEPQLASPDLFILAQVAAIITSK